MHKTNKEFFQSKLTKKPSNPEPQVTKQIHVNIQNVLSNKKLNLIEAHSERGTSHHKK
jgi:phage/plasmid-associated DNA primase